MNLISKFLHRKDVELTPEQHQMYERERLERDPILQRPWIGEFNLDDPAELKAARQIYTLEQKPGQEFRVFKNATSEHRTYKRGVEMGEFRLFPSSDEIWEAYGEIWGGGHYTIKAKLPPTTVWTYSFDAPPKHPKPEEPNRAKNGNEEVDLKATMELGALKAYFEDLKANPDAMREFGAGIAAKKFGIKVGKKEATDLDTDLLREALESDPVLMADYKRRLIDSRFKPKKEATLLDDIKRVKEMAKALGMGDEEKGKGVNWTEVIGSFAENLPEILEKGAGMMTMLRGGNTPPQPQLPPGQQVQTIQAPYQVRPVTPQSQAPAQAPAPRPVVQPVPAQPAQPQGPQATSPTPPAPSPVQEAAIMKPTDPPAPLKLDMAALMPLVKSVNPDALLLAAQGDPGTFVTDCHKTLFEGADDPQTDAAEQVIKVLRDNDPRTLYAALQDALPKVRDNALAKVMLGADHPKLIKIMETLTLEWITKAHLACVYYEQKLKEKNLEMEQEMKKDVEGKMSTTTPQSSSPVPPPSTPQVFDSPSPSDPFGPLT